MIEGAPVEGRQYQIREVLGRGGFGTVYRADLASAGGFVRPVALKVLNPDVEGIDDVARRLRDEARMLGKLGHRSIVHVDGLVLLEGRWTVVMAYVHGVDLRAVVTAGPVPVGPALEIVQEVAAALHVAFERATPTGEVLRLLHRDIKPANVQLTTTGEVKLLDFGIARAEMADKEAVTRSVTYGSLPYMSPERLDFEDSHAGDVYALGAVLYELLTAEPLGKTSAAEGRHAALRDGALQRLAEAGLPREVVAFVGAMLAYEPADRPSARECERWARRLRAAAPEPSLADFAESVVPPLLARRAAAPDSLTGRTLSESTSRRREHVTGLPVATGRRPSGVLVGAAAGLAAVAGAAGAALLGLVALWLLWPRAPSPVADPTPVEAARPTPPPAMSPSTPPTSATPAREARPRRGPAPEVVAPEGPPAASPPALPSVDVDVGTVIVEGDATSVVLVRDGLRQPPGEVPPGEYQVRATFPGREEIPAGRVRVGAGEQVHLKCAAGFERCVLR